MPLLKENTFRNKTSWDLNPGGHSSNLGRSSPVCAEAHLTCPKLKRSLSFVSAEEQTGQQNIHLHHGSHKWLQEKGAKKEEIWGRKKKRCKNMNPWNSKWRRVGWEEKCSFFKVLNLLRPIMGEILLVLLINRQLMKHKTQNSPNCVMEVTLQWKRLPSPGVLSASPGPTPVQATERFTGRQWRPRSQPEPRMLWGREEKWACFTGCDSWSSDDLGAQEGLQFRGMDRALPSLSKGSQRATPMYKTHRCALILQQCLHVHATNLPNAD